jgi:FkbM family methyltransferase
MRTYSPAGISLDENNKLISNWENNLKIQYSFPLTPESLMWDIGGHDGDYTAKMLEVKGFSPFIAIFEPVAEWYRKCQDRFASDPKIVVYPVGLSNEDRTSVVYRQPDEYATSEYMPNSRPIPVLMMDVAKVVPKKIDLMMMNCEGGEYRILPRLLDTGLINNVEHLLVQFHHLFPEAGEMRELLCERIGETHEHICEYPFAWDSWRRK